MKSSGNNNEPIGNNNQAIPKNLMTAEAINMMQSIIQANRDNNMNLLLPPPPIPPFLLGTNNANNHDNQPPITSHSSISTPQILPPSMLHCRKPNLLPPPPFFSTQIPPFPIPLPTLTSSNNPNLSPGPPTKRPFTQETYERLCRNTFLNHQPLHNLNQHPHHHHHHHHPFHGLPNFGPLQRFPLMMNPTFYQSNNVKHTNIMNNKRLINNKVIDPYLKGQLIRLMNGELKPVETLSITDFEFKNPDGKFENCDIKPNLELEVVEGRVCLIEVRHDDSTARIHLEIANNKQSIIVVPISKPLFSKSDGWCSIEPTSCHQKHHLTTNILQLDHIILCLTKPKRAKIQPSRRSKSKSQSSASSNNRADQNNNCILNENKSVDNLSNDEMKSPDQNTNISSNSPNRFQSY